MIAHARRALLPAGALLLLLATACTPPGPSGSPTPDPAAPPTSTSAPTMTTDSPTDDSGHSGPSTSSPSTASSGGDGGAVDAAQRAGRAFLADYVDPDGRVVRRDQGGDTVSEGQAYAMLVAVALEDRATFDLVWGWARANLQRPDGLLSWRWADGAVADPQPASDADLDAARALVLAGEAFGDPTLTESATALGRAVLDRQTVVTDAGRILLAGPWAASAPYQVNPSYSTPVATQLLAELDGDPRWAELDAGSRGVVAALTGGGALPPNWALVDVAGTPSPSPGPDGRPISFGYDAARTLTRHAESCAASDRDVVAPALITLPTGTVLHAELDLDGDAVTTDQHPVTHVSRAAVRALAGTSRARSPTSAAPMLCWPATPPTTARPGRRSDVSRCRRTCWAAARRWEATASPASRRRVAQATR
ncbi:glycosyl hydrolase family 8 [Litorihabitans aurantiacus]|uniref:Cellulase n=1 Tax=Litorihabitans aurantiacus TaxID=1930061 RepID=A0AA37XFL0_9MICO|nr:glycosyl hydrolase family 8 [Litorihabitans aurantiacus]GMA32328.1 hypothetical protein GCM10025875_23200 [Litorihabitans aurantiacus]